MRFKAWKCSVMEIDFYNLNISYRIKISSQLIKKLFNLILKFVF